MDRRHVLKTAMFGMLAGSAAAAPSLPDNSLFTSDPEAYWKRIREEQFFLPDWRIFLNNGSMGPMPKPVVAAVSAKLESGASLLTDEYPRWGYELLDAERTEMAAFVGCKKDELAFMHNATEAMSTIADGLDLAPGDEVLITDQEHPSGKGPWTRKQARYKIALREVALPIPPRSSAELADRVISAIGPKTKVLSFSGITTTTGLRMPVREICDAARAKGVLTVVDGAHMAGQVPVRIADLNCDFWAGSPHKWLFAPAGSGLMYVREENLERLWPSTVTGNWNDLSLKAARYMMIGTNNRALVEGMMAGLRFHKALGSERVYGRLNQLARSVYAEAAKRPYLKPLSGADPSLYGGLVSFELPKDDAKFWALCKQRRIWLMHANRTRVSTHVHTRPSDIKNLFATLDEAFA